MINNPERTAREVRSESLERSRVRMKKWIAAVLAMLMLCAGMAQAAEWPEGKSPSKPYLNLPEINLNQNIGYMIFSPSAIVPVQYSCQRLFIFLPREDVKAGDGKLHLYSEKGSKIWSTTLSNDEAVTKREIAEDELEGLMWGGGTCFEIKLPKTLDLGKSYYVNLDEGCLVAEDDSVRNLAVTGSDKWAFSVDGEFGVSGVEYLHEGEATLSPASGDAIRFDLQLGGEAVSAVLISYENSVSFYNTKYSQSVEVKGSVTGGSPKWAVRFLDAANNVIEEVTFY